MASAHTGSAERLRGFAEIHEQDKTLWQQRVAAQSGDLRIPQRRVPLMTPFDDSHWRCFGHDRGARQRPPYEKCDKSPSLSIGSARFPESFFRKGRVVRSARSTHCALRRLGLACNQCGSCAATRNAQPLLHIIRRDMSLWAVMQGRDRYDSSPIRCRGLLRGGDCRRREV